MPKIADLARLFRALSLKDWTSALAVAEQIAAAEDTAGHHVAAKTLRGALNGTGPRADAMEDKPASHLVFVPDVLAEIRESRSLNTIELAPKTVRLLQELLKEHRNITALARHGLQPRRRILFHGPPGCGKSITAGALASELHLRLFVVRFDALVGAFLGQTAVRIREVFQFAEQTPSVIFIDEIDAVGRRRGDRSDVGELDRIVISLMQQLDLVHPAGLLIAASNVPDVLDPALVRRFDAVAEFPEPSKTRLRSFAQKEATKRGLTINGTRQELTSARTYADVERVIITEQRRSVLQEV